MTSVVNVKKKFLIDAGYKDLDDWLKNPNHIYIGRDMTFYVKSAFGSKWANPFKVKKYGIDKCLEMYKEYILNNKELMNQITELEGKVLGCWCITEKDNKCHGNVLIDILKSIKRD